MAVANQEVDFANWMGQLSPKLHDVPINGLAIPGSHDSATSYSTVNSPLSPDGCKYLKLLVDVFGKKGKQIISHWDRTQNISFTEQLKAGIRYFDLRTCYRATDYDFYFVHSVYCVKVSVAMKELNAYLDEHTYEAILLDFNHFYAMTSELHSRLRTEILAIFGSKVCPVTKVSSVTLTSLWQQEKQVLVFYHENSTTDCNFWSGDLIPAPWPNTTKIAKLITFLEDHYNEGKSAELFYVTQGILTPTVPYIMGHLNSSLKMCMSIPTDQVLVPWLNNKIASPTKMNICTCDFVDYCDFIPTVISLNYDN